MKGKCFAADYRLPSARRFPRPIRQHSALQSAQNEAIILLKLFFQVMNKTPLTTYIINYRQEIDY